MALPTEDGARPLTYNHVLNRSGPEIQLTQKKTLQNGTQNNNTANATSPQKLNLSDGYADTLVDRVIEYRNRADARNGIDLDAQAHQRKETAQAHLDSYKKRVSAGLLASASIHALGPKVLTSAMVRKRKAEELVTERKNKRQHEFMNKLWNKFMALRAAANKREHTMLSSVPEIKILVRWFRQWRFPGTTNKTSPA